MPNNRAARLSNYQDFSYQYGIIWTYTLINPKRHGLFGQLDTWGGWNHPAGHKRSITPPNFIPEQQTVSHMKAEVFS